MISSSVTRIDDPTATEAALVVRHSRNMAKSTSGLCVYYSKEYKKLLKRYQTWKEKQTGKTPSIQSVLILGGYEKMRREMGESFEVSNGD